MSGDYFTAELNDGKHVFVFGSNEGGIHGAGAALCARQSWGAEIGVGFGPTGQSFAIPTKSDRFKTLSLKAIDASVKLFLKHAENHPEMTFLVTKIGCGLAGYSEGEIKPMFAGASANCVLPEGWR